VVDLSVCQSVGHDREPCKKAEPIEMLFGIWTPVGPRKHALDGDQILKRRGAILREKETVHCKV